MGRSCWRTVAWQAQSHPSRRPGRPEGGRSASSSRSWSWWDSRRPSCVGRGRVRPGRGGRPTRSTQPPLMRIPARRSATWGMRPASAATRRSPRPTAGTRWAARCPRSMTAPATGGDEADGRALFEAQGLEYSIEHRDGRVFHQETRRDSSGRVIARNEAEVQFVLGSGRQGVGLPDRARRLPLPVADHLVFRGSGGGTCPRATRRTNPHFDRPVHSDVPVLPREPGRAGGGDGQPVSAADLPGPRDRLRAVPRARRAARRGIPTVVDGRDTTIVNPAALEPSLRDAVCEQCHLMGQRRVVKLDRQDEDYPARAAVLHEFWSVFETAAGTARIGSSARSSRCTRADASAPAGAGSAASPATIRIAGRRPRSGSAITGIAAWSATPIGVAASRRAARLRAESRRRLHHLPHAATERHPTSCMSPRPTIASPARRARRTIPDPPRPRAPPKGPLVLFHRDLMDERQRAEAERDLGVASARRLGEGAGGPGPAVARGGRGGDGRTTWTPGRPRGSRWASRRASRRPGRLPDGPGPGTRTGSPRRSARPTSPPGRAGARTPSPTAARDRHQPLAPDYHADLAPLHVRRPRLARPRPRPAGRPSASTPPTWRPGSCSSGAPSPPGRHRGRPRANSRPSWDSIPRTARS